MLNNFWDCYEYSIGEREKFDASLLLAHLPHAADVQKTDTETDKQGVDYIITMKDGSKLTVDAKTRKPGAAKYWRNREPELALEEYSVRERKTIGWLFKKGLIHPDYILYTFDATDTDKFYFIPYALLRKAAHDNWQEWKFRYGVKPQKNDGGYTSTAIFTPAPVVIRALTAAMVGFAA